MSKREYRLYGLVPYNISEIQKGIQFGHAVVEYGLKCFKNIDYQQWAKKDKTFIILNGGTTNLKSSSGTLNKHLLYLQNTNLKFATFFEPDLGDQLTAVVFLVDDRIWDKENFPDLNWAQKNLENTNSKEFQKVKSNWLKKFSKDLTEAQEIEKIREWLKSFKLA